MISVSKQKKLPGIRILISIDKPICRNVKVLARKDLSLQN